MNKNKPLIGFCGQGWIGANYADDFEYRGFEVIRYSLESKYIQNKNKIKDCDIVFIAVPTPTNSDGFDDSILQNVLHLIGDNKIAVIKSTIVSGTTKKMQKLFPDITVLHSPEFLTEATAKYDVVHPKRNIIGFVNSEDSGKAMVAIGKAYIVMSVLPDAPYKSVVHSEVAEMIKYGGNCWFYFKVIYMNLLYDLCKKQDIDFEMVKEGMSWDNRIGFTHLDVIHQGGRGAGGHCFIKDFAAFVDMYDKECADDAIGRMLLGKMEDKNIQLLTKSKKDIDLLTGVYGEKVKEN